MLAVTTLALKDLRLLVRDRFGMFWILAVPLMFALFFGVIFGGMGAPGSNPLRVAVIDEDDTDDSRRFVESLKQSKALTLSTPTLDEARDLVRRGKLVAYVVLKPGFGKAAGFFGGPSKQIELGVDPSRKAEVEFLKGLLTAESFKGFDELFKNPKKASAEMQTALKDLENAEDMPKELLDELKQMFVGIERFLKKADPKMMEKAPKQEPLKIEVTDLSARQGRPRSPFEITFPSSVLWGLLGCVSAFSVSIVTERTQGTLLRLRTAPLSWTQIVLGKGLACFLASISVAVGLLGLAALIFGVRLDDPVKLALAIGSTALGFTGIMMFLSTLGKTEQGVAGAGWGVMMPMAMIGGCMVPLIAMPGWMQNLSGISPVKWGIVALEGAIWRDFSYEEMLLPCGIQIGVGVVFFLLGVQLLSRRE